MSRFLDTGVAGVSVIYHERRAGNFTLTIEVDPLVKSNEDYQLASKHPAIAAELVLEHCQKSRPNYLIFSLILGLLIPLIEERARSK